MPPDLATVAAQLNAQAAPVALLVTDPEQAVAYREGAALPGSYVLVLDEKHVPKRLGGMVVLGPVDQKLIQAALVAVGK